MNIQDAKLDFGSLSRRASTKRIVLHNADASTSSPQQIHAWHKANGWSGAGYHFLVRKDGSVWALRPEWAVGAHASGANSDSLGVCFEGKYMTETMPQAQIDAGRELVGHLKSKYGIGAVVRHKDVGSTDCPGVNFPFDAIVNGAAAPSKPKEEPVKPKQPTSKPKNDTGVNYRAYVQKGGWLAVVHDGMTAGTVGQGLRMEAFKVDFRKSKVIPARVDVTLHLQGTGDVKYRNVTNDTVLGTTGQSRRIEAVTIDAYGLPEGVHLLYRVHSAKVGWSDWVTEGNVAGTIGDALGVQAIELYIA